MRRLKKPPLRSTSEGVVRVVLFFLHHSFVPLGFPDKVLMRQHEAYYDPEWLWHPRGSVINQLVDVHNRPGP